MRQGDGDTSLVFFPRDVSPNHHALAERFGLFDRFFVNAEVSPDGHNWSMAAYATDYLEKTVPSNYSARGRAVRLRGPEPRRDSRGRRRRAGERLPLESRREERASRSATTASSCPPCNATPDDPLPPGYRGNKPFLVANTNPTYPGFDLGDSRPASRRRLARGVQPVRRRAARCRRSRSCACRTTTRRARRPDVRRRAPPSRTTISRSAAWSRRCRKSPFWREDGRCSCSRTTRRTVPITSTRTDRRCS